MTLEDLVSFVIGLHPEFSVVPTFDLGLIKAIDKPTDMSVAGFEAAFNAGKTLYNFASDTHNDDINVDTYFGFDPVTGYSRTHATMSYDDLPAEKLPENCQIVGDTKVISFENVTSSNISSYIWNEPDYPNCEISVVKRANDGTISGNKAIHVKLGKSTERDKSAALELNVSGYVKSIDAQAKGVTFWIKNCQNKPFHMNVGFDMGHRWTARENYEYATYQLYNTKTGEEMIRNGHFQGIYIPADFEGYVRISFTEYFAAGWVSAPMDWEEALAIGSVSYMVVDASTDLYEGYEFEIDNIGWYYGEATTERLFLDFGDNKPTIKEIMTSDYFATSQEASIAKIDVALPEKKASEQE